MAAKAWNGGKWIRPEKRLAIYIRDGFTCQYCGADLRDAPPAEVTLDHLVCRTHGGGNEAGNLILACKSCNSARGAKAWQEYATGGAVERIVRQRLLPINVWLAKSIIAGEANEEVEDAR